MSLTPGTSLFLQITDALRREIARLAPGSRLETDIGLARRFSVSTSVIREALSILGRDGVITRQVGRGTFVKDPHAGRPVAILCDLDLCSLPSPVSMLQNVLEGGRQLEAHGYETVTYLGEHAPTSEPPSRLSSRQFLKDLGRKSFAGVFAPWAFPHEQWTAPLKQAGVPIVGIGPLHEHMVFHDYGTFIRLALETLKQQGRRKIALLSGPAAWNLGGHDLLLREQTVRLFYEAGVEVREGWFHHDWHYSVKGGGWTSFREIWTHYKEKPDGLIVLNEAMWPDINMALDSLKLDVPRDLHIVLSRATASISRWQIPNVTQISFDTRRMTEEAIRLLLELMAGPKPAQTRRQVDAWTVHPPVVAPGHTIRHQAESFLPIVL